MTTISTLTYRELGSNIQREARACLGGPRRSLLWLGIAVLFGWLPDEAFAQPIFSAVPDRLAVNAPDGAEMRELKTDEAERARITIVQSSGRYYWASRENIPLLHHSAGAMHFFIAPNGAGYIKIFDQAFIPESMREPGSRYQFYEHMNLMMATFTYFGSADRLDIRD